ncbi:MAG: hypothetical protein HUJ61_04315 [Bacilli bacterium]|nr:hypothetical protein [Bacilli bacterium]
MFCFALCLALTVIVIALSIHSFNEKKILDKELEKAISLIEAELEDLCENQRSLKKQIAQIELNMKISKLK